MRRGYYDGPVDGLYGPRTDTAIRDFERAAGLKPSALMLLGSSPFTELIKHPKGRLTRLLRTDAKDDAIVEDLFLAVLGRTPSDKERDAVRKHIAQGKDARGRQAAFEDILWALLNANEFLINP